MCYQIIFRTVPYPFDLVNPSMSLVAGAFLPPKSVLLDPVTLFIKLEGNKRSQHWHWQSAFARAQFEHGKGVIAS